MIPAAIDLTSIKNIKCDADADFMREQHRSLLSGPALDFGFGNLIDVEDHLSWFGYCLHQQEVVMPHDSILVSAAVVSVFLIFVLLWGDLQTRPMRQQTADRNRKRRAF